jgi:hypothetical protein
LLGAPGLPPSRQGARAGRIHQPDRHRLRAEATPDLEHAHTFDLALAIDASVPTRPPIRVERITPIWLAIGLASTIGDGIGGEVGLPGGLDKL